VDASLPVVVLGFHHGGLGIARSLGRWGVRVLGVDADPAAPGLLSRYCRDRAVWNVARADPAASVRFLLELAARAGGRALLVPTSDDAALFVATHAAELRGAYVFQDNPPELVAALSDKRELFHLCRAHGVPTPEISFPRTRDELLAFADAADFPVMLKGIDGLKLQARTGTKMRIVRTRDELVRAYDELEDPREPNLMLQEYIPGGDDTIWMFNGYFGADSECRAGFTGKKLRQHPVHTGSTSLGICERNETVFRQTTDFMRAIGYRGILDIGWRFDARDGGYKLLDPNPRIGSTFRLFVDRAGMDVVRYLYLDATGQPLPPAVQREGRRWMVEERDLESSLDYAREGSLSLADWVRSFRGVEEAAWFAWDDPRPFLRVAGETAQRGAAMARRRVLAREPAGAALPAAAGA
jgi:predicted ATP-grasp superfamily ATP-dependent carboligase